MGNVDFGFQEATYTITLTESEMELVRGCLQGIADQDEANGINDEAQKLRKLLEYAFYLKDTP